MEQKPDKINKKKSKKESESKPEERTSKIRSVSSLSSTSDLDENLSDEERYRKIAKKLARDKVELKTKLKNMIETEEEKNENHRRELETAQIYFQNQLDELIEERDKCKEDLDNIKSSFIEEKEKLRQHYENKINKQKEISEKRYGNSTSVKRLESTIISLQEKLNEQIEEKDRIKEIAEQLYSQKEEEFRKSIIDLQEQLQKAKDLHLKDRKEFQVLAKTFADEKEAIIRKSAKEKDEEILQVTIEKNSIINTLQNIREQMDKRTREADNKRDEQIMQAKAETDALRSEYERKYNEFLSTGKKNLEDMKMDFDMKLSACEKNNKIDLEALSKDNERKLQNLNSENSRKIEVLTDNFNREIEEYKKLISKLQSDSIILSSNFSKKEEEYKKTIEKIITECSKKLEDKERELCDSKLKCEKISGESEEIIQRLKEQLSQVRDNVKKLQDSSQTMNTQFVTNLNRQKDFADKEIAVRDQTILQLERQNKKIADESLDRINMMEKKIKMYADDIKEITDKFNNSKSIIEKAEQQNNLIKIEMQKVKENNEKITEKARQLSFEKETDEKRYKFDMEQKKQECDILLKNIEDMKTKFFQLQNAIHQNHIKSKETENEIEQKEKTISIQKREIDNITQSLTLSNNELTRIKKSYTEEVKQKCDEIRIEKERQIGEINKRIASLEASLKNSEQTRQQLEQNLISVSADRDRYKNSLETPLAEIASKTKEIQKLHEEITRVKGNFTSTLNNITQEFKMKESELITVKTKLTEYEAKEGMQAPEIEKLKEALSTIKNSYESMLAKISEEKQQEIVRLAKKVTDTEILLFNQEQKNDKLRQEFQRQLVEIRKNPHEDKSKKYEKEISQLQSHLENADKKLSTLQLEYAQTVATYKVKNEQLQEKENNLKKLEENLKNTQPKLLDPTLRKARDDALANLRHSKIELSKAKEESLEMLQKLTVAENLIKDLEREKQLILKAQSDLKETFVNNLNQQQEKHEKEISERNERIKELEKILSEKFKN